MINKYFATYVATAIDEINKFCGKSFYYGEIELPNSIEAFKIWERGPIDDPNADYVCVALEPVHQNVKLSFCSPSKPSLDKEKTIAGSEFSANPLDSFLKQVFQF